MTDFNYDEVGRKHTINGLPAPSVTQILQGVGTVDYSSAPANAMARGADRGRKVHTSCQLLDEGDLDESTLDEVLLGYVEGYKKFLAESDFTIVKQEEPVACEELGYVGKPDKLGLLNFEPCILDIKTGEVKEWVALQIWGYGLAIHGLDYGGTDLHCALQLTKDGKYRLHTQSKRGRPFNSLIYRDLWLSAAKLHHFNHS